MNLDQLMQGKNLISELDVHLPDFKLNSFKYRQQNFRRQIELLTFFHSFRVNMETWTQISYLMDPARLLL